MSVIAEEWKNRETTPIDFIVVGSGAGGAPLAARLVERGYTVLVLEMGPEKPNIPEGSRVESTKVPLLHTETTEDPRHSLKYFVKHFETDPEGSLDPKVHRPKDGEKDPDTGKPYGPDDRGIFYPRAQGLGGCTIHNAMITVCGPSEDWDEIAEATGDESWRGERMRAYFERLENCHYNKPTLWGKIKKLFGCKDAWDNGRHGDSGWLHTTLASLRFLKADRQLLKIVLKAAVVALGTGLERIGSWVGAVITGRVFPSLDPNHWETMRRSPEGLTRIPVAVTEEGERSSPRDRLLKCKNDSHHGHRLHLATGVFVTEVLLEDGSSEARVGGMDARHRAVGVSCLPREHVYEADPNSQPVGDDWNNHVVAVYCKREVILCGGSFNTPQLLMLSGIGPEDHLHKNGIPTRVHLPGVGLNLQDRYEVPITASASEQFWSIRGLGVSSKSDDKYLTQWIQQEGQSAYSRGIYSSNGGLVGILKRSNQEDFAPDLFIFALAGNFRGYAVGYSKPDKLNLPSQDDPDARRALTWLILKARTRHHAGHVRLQSNSPFQRPEINFRSFPMAPDEDLSSDTPTRDQDLEALHQGVEFVRHILAEGVQAGSIASFDMPECSDQIGGNVRKWIKHVAWGHHACGTCKIGTEEDAVLDSRFRVRGVTGLRVVDASVFRRIPGFFIVTNIYMVSEKAADVLTEDNPSPWNELSPEVRDALANDPVFPSRKEHEARRLYPAQVEAAEANLIAERRRKAGLSH